jgi:hypothetical protein
MKVPNAIIGRTEPSGRPLAYLEAYPNKAGQIVGNALSNFGSAAEDYFNQGQEILNQREAKTQHFDALSNYTDFEGKIERDLTDMKQKADPSGKGFFKQANDYYDQQAASQLAAVPERLRPEFKLHYENLKQRVLNQSLDFQYKAGDAYYRSKISDTVSRATESIASIPSGLEEWRKRINEQIDLSDLDPAGKDDVKRKATLAIESTAYKANQTEQKYGVITKYSQFNTELQQGLTQLQRSNPNSREYYSEASKLYDEKSKPFMESLPEELRGEYKARLAEAKTKLLDEALTFSNEQGDKQDLADIKTELDKEKVKVDNYPAKWQESRDRLNAKIDSTSLSAASKKALKQDIESSLATVKETVEEQRGIAKPGSSGLGSVSGDTGHIIEEEAKAAGVDPEVAKKIAWIESKGNPRAGEGKKYQGLFQMGPDEQKKYGVTNPFDARDNARGALKYIAENTAALRSALGREPTTGEIYLAHQQGLGGAKALLGNPNENVLTVLSRVYPNRDYAAKAITGNGGSLSMTAGQFAGMWMKKAGDAHPQFGGMDADPSYSSVPYETRVSLRNDALVAATKRAADEDKAAADAENSLTNSLMLGIAHGQYGRTDVESLLDSGKITKYENYNKAVEAIDKRDKESNIYAQTLQRLGDENSIFNPMAEDEKKAMNIVVDKSGLIGEITQGNQQAVQQTLIPLVQRSHMIATDVVGTLEGMTRSGKPGVSMYAYDTLSQLQNADPGAFAQGVTGDLAANVKYYQEHKNLLPQDELLKGLGIGVDQAYRQGQDFLRKEGEKILDRHDTKNVPHIDEIFSSVLKPVGGGWTTPNLPRNANAQASMFQEFRTIWLDEYARYRDEAKTTEATIERLKSYWGTTNVGNRWTVMRDPPDKAGYKELWPGEGMAFINRQVRQELALPATSTFELVSDDQTRNEAQKYKAGQGPPPSYIVTYYDANGTPHTPTATVGNGLRRFNFIPTPADQFEAKKNFVKEDVQTRFNEFMDRFAKYSEFARQTGNPIPEEIQKERQDLENQMRKNAPAPESELTQQPIPFGTPGTPVLRRPDFTPRGGPAQSAIDSMQVPVAPPTQVPTAVGAPPMEQGVVKRPAADIIQGTEGRGLVRDTERTFTVPAPEPPKKKKPYVAKGLPEIK